MSHTSTQLDHSYKLFVAKDEHKFSCAHMTIFADGTKERLHGHNFRASIAVTIDANTGGLLDFA
ncbi:MAG: 6-carboxytetrahydropterin synthase, partial [Polyangiaceae bacterium]|nr:6-carboxytetrahydropterin synthase [Polyangiaceae bacterium]